MKPVLITQRVDVVADRAERRDALDQRWHELGLQAGLRCTSVPNNLDWVTARLADGGDFGLLLTGGNSLAGCGGLAPERDEVERMLLQAAVNRGAPVLGVCRGMQLLLDFFGGELQPVSGHVAASQTITVRGERTEVNSYHDWGAKAAPGELRVWATADDGVIKAVKHEELPIWGIMWHPERMAPFRAADLALLREVYGSEVPA